MPFEAGSLTAVATDASGAIVATTVRHSNSQKASLQLTVDAPNERTGTGSRLMLDGHDAALLRATVLDHFKPYPYPYPHPYPYPRSSTPTADR